MADPFEEFLGDVVRLIVREPGIPTPLEVPGFSGVSGAEVLHRGIRPILLFCRSREFERRFERIDSLDEDSDRARIPRRALAAGGREEPCRLGLLAAAAHAAAVGAVVAGDDLDAGLGFQAVW
jgi:hypothetical protein